MPSPTRCLTAGDALSFVRDRAVHRPTSRPRIGLELEWLTHHRHDRRRRVTPGDLAAVVDALDGHLPCGGRLSIEPGGQIELSSPPCASAAAAIDAARADAAVLTAALGRHDIGLEAAGVDRDRPPQRVVDAPRYRAMEAYFDALGAEGRTMMCNSAALQINIDVDGDAREAWRAANAAAAVLASTFNAASPNRADLWHRIDRTRTAPVDSDDPATGWAEYALRARVMFVRVSPTACVPVLDGTTFVEWIERGHELGWPTEDDLAEHLTTLFPPVRPRGWFEIRTVDALPDACWPRAVELAAALVLDGPQRRAFLDSGEVPTCN